MSNFSLSSKEERETRCRKWRKDEFQNVIYQRIERHIQELDLDDSGICQWYVSILFQGASCPTKMLWWVATEHPMLGIFHGKPHLSQMNMSWHNERLLCVCRCVHICLCYSCLIAEILLTTVLKEKAKFGN